MLLSSQLRPALCGLGLLLLTGCATTELASPSVATPTLEHRGRADQAATFPSAAPLASGREAALRSSLTPQPVLAPPPGATLPLEIIIDQQARGLDLTVPPQDLWERIRRGFGMPDLHSPLVAERQSWYLNRPEMLRRIFERGRRYLFHIVEELEKRGMPTELALLPMVESAYNPQAVSRARAMGIWQFIPSTGKSYDLAQNWWVDERRDILASTDAALRYLQNIYEMHGDWHLALASYNWGENAVARAIARNAAQGLPTDYASLSMPDETRYYVPKLQALKNIVAQPEVYGIRLPSIPNQPYFETVVKPARIDVDIAARLAGMSIEEFVSLNPAYQRPVIKEGHAGPLLLPTDRVETFLSNLARHAAEDKPLSRWLTYTVRRGDTLRAIATRHRITEQRLREINGINARARVAPGFTLLVPRPGSQVNVENPARALPRETSARATKKTTPVKKKPAVATPAVKRSAPKKKPAAPPPRPRKQAHAAK